jgi:hypothetical protein
MRGRDTLTVQMVRQWSNRPYGTPRSGATWLRFRGSHPPFAGTLSARGTVHGEYGPLNGSRGIRHPGRYAWFVDGRNHVHHRCASASCSRLRLRVVCILPRPTASPSASEPWGGTQLWLIDEGYGRCPPQDRLSGQLQLTLHPPWSARLYRGSGVSRQESPHCAITSRLGKALSRALRGSRRLSSRRWLLSPL